ncbi:hypothetical protein FB567DRAFT_624875 [Paraphoma chrysanthemicola]|uniref:Phosphotransferase n=1 Tax=Paraphoma chrysanthemicola TaxID=798071 RepID=A0A8K0W2Z6_9PLEO|nr:hypothetical protein FB567DRAFT_624875 [Paraphoma chrysanthemicola]
MIQSWKELNSSRSSSLTLSRLQFFWPRVPFTFVMVKVHRYLTWIRGLCDKSVSRSNDLEIPVGVEENAVRISHQSGSETEIEEQSSLQTVAEEIAQGFHFSDERLAAVVSGFMKQMNEGLSSHGCMIEQLPSYITQIPTGQEKGTYLAVDLGGTNIRICSVALHGDGTYDLTQEKAVIPVHLMTSIEPMELFRWVAALIHQFLMKHHPDSATLGQPSISPAFDLGFTFSHAVQQTSIKSGTLIRWSKGFDIRGVVGQDICALLQSALTEFRLPVRVTALTNDTIGTLLARAYIAPDTATTIMGAVFGTGTNGAYIEQAANITKLGGPNTRLMIVNSEWGNFDQNLEYLPFTEFDKMVDARSVNPGLEKFEKMVSGMYLGEILRLAIFYLLEVSKTNATTDIKIPAASKLDEQWSLDASILTILEADTSLDLSVSRTAIEQGLGLGSVSCAVAKAFRTIACSIGKRAARLGAVAIGAVILQTNSLVAHSERPKRIDIGVDGSLIELYPPFLIEMRKALSCIDGIGADGLARVDIILTKDGSGVGAALAALIILVFTK